MNIGLDIDNVISDFDKGMLPLFLEEDKNKRNAGTINKNLHYLKGMLDWSEEEIEEHMCKVCEPCAKTLPVKYGARKYMNKLLEEGHNLILITFRTTPYFKDGKGVTEKWLKTRKINYTKLVISASPNKTQECIDNQIDVMFDDRAKHVATMRENGINCVLVLAKYNKEDAKRMPSVSSWKALYEYVKNMEK